MASPARSVSATPALLICAAAWAIPGAGHLWQGRTQKGVVFLVTLTLMFAAGLWLEGRLFPFQLSEPLVALAAFADTGMGRAVAVTFEYGNTFAIVSGLLNMLAVLDAYDIAQGRK